MHTPTETKSSHGKADEKNNKLGISRGIYAFGYSFKDAFIWGTAITAALIPIIHSMRETKLLKWIKISSQNNWLKEKIEKLKDLVPKWGPSIGLAAGLGWTISHIIQIPSAIVGWNKAQTAINKHAALGVEKSQLVTLNQHLQEENNALKASLAKIAEVPHTERLQSRTAASAAVEGPTP